VGTSQEDRQLDPASNEVLFMRKAVRAGIGASVLALIASVVQNPVAGQAPGAGDAGAKTQSTSAWQVPRTSWGHPDLQGVWTGNS
jgi:hypothetical protein